MIEAELLVATMDLATALGWRCLHVRAGMTAHGWRTPVSGQGAGFPDALLLRERIVAIELKSATGRVTLEQQAWPDAFEEAGGEAWVFRPADWASGAIMRVLARVPSAPSPGPPKVQGGDVIRRSRPPRDPTG